jgi:small subunit ribosomal protein S9
MTIKLLAYSIGKRKKSTSKVSLLTGNGKLVINNINGSIYLQNCLLYLRKIYIPFAVLNIKNNFDIHIKTKGGGLSGQVDAIVLGISRALVTLNILNRPILKMAGLLNRNARNIERKKYGLKKARKAEQYSKR